MESALSLPRKAWVELNVFDGRGRRAASLFHGKQAAGLVNRRWTPTREFSSGLNLVRMRAGGQSLALKFVLIQQDERQGSAAKCVIPSPRLNRRTNEASRASRFFTMALSMYTETGIQTWLLTAFSDGTRKRLTRRPCSIRSKWDSTGPRLW